MCCAKFCLIPWPWILSSIQYSCHQIFSMSIFLHVFNKVRSWCADKAKLHTLCIPLLCWRSLWRTRTGVIFHTFKFYKLSRIFRNCRLWAQQDAFAAFSLLFLLLYQLNDRLSGFKIHLSHRWHFNHWFEMSKGKKA